MTESFPKDTIPPNENHEIITTKLHQMSVDFFRISKAQQLPSPDSTLFLDAVVQYKNEVVWGSRAKGVKEVFVAPNNKHFIDEESGLKVQPTFIHSYYGADPDSLPLRFSVPVGNRERTVDKVAEWLAEHHDAGTAEDMTRNLYSTYAREHRLTYLHGSTGPVQMEVIRPGSKSSPQFVPIGPSFGAFMHGIPAKTHAPQLLIGPIHYNHYNGPSEDHGIHGHLYDLPAKDLAMFARVLDKAVSRLVRLDDITIKG